MDSNTSVLTKNQPTKEFLIYCKMVEKSTTLSKNIEKFMPYEECLEHIKIINNRPVTDSAWFYSQMCKAVSATLEEYHNRNNKQLGFLEAIVDFYSIPRNIKRKEVIKKYQQKFIDFLDGVDDRLHELEEMEENNSDDDLEEVFVAAIDTITGLMEKLELLLQEYDSEYQNI